MGKKSLGVRKRSVEGKISLGVRKRSQMLQMYPWQENVVTYSTLNTILVYLADNYGEG